MPFRNDGEGLHRSVDPADGKHYVYGMSFMDAAPTIFACFDQPDLKAPYTFHVRAPQDWVVIGNAPGRQVEPGVWEFEQSQPLSTYFVTLVAGPYHVLRDEHDGIPLGLSARASIAADLDKDADELFTLTRQSFDELHRLFGIRYPFGDYHQAFVPEFNAGAMENPGCVTFRDPLIFTSRVTRGIRIARASTIAHEMAHQWFGNLVTPAWWDDLWLNESFAEYLGNRVTADVTEYADVVGRQLLRAPPVGAGRRPAAEHPPGRRQRRGRRERRAAGLRRHLLRQGLRDPAPAQRHRWATRCSSRAPSTTSSGTASATPRCTTCSRAGSAPEPATCRASPTTGCAPRARTGSSSTARAGVVRRTPPADHPADRPHRIRAAVARGRHLDRPRAGDRRPGDAVRRRRPAGAARPLQRHLGAADPRQADHGRAREPAPPHHRPRAPRRALEQRPQRAAQRRRRPGRRARDRGREPAGRGHRGQPAAHHGVGLRLGGAAAARPRGRAGRAARRRASPSSTTAAPDLGGAAVRRSGPRSRTGVRPRPCCAAGWPATGCPTGVPLDVDLRWRVLVRLATLGAVDLAELDRQLEAEPTGGGPGAPRRRARLAARTPRPRPGPGPASPARSTCPTTSSRRWASGFWRGGQEELTDAVRRALLRRPARHRQACAAAGCSPDAAEHFFPRTSLTRETLARAEALIADGDLDLSIRRRLVDEADTLERKLAVLEAYPRP